MVDQLKRSAPALLVIAVTLLSGAAGPVADAQERGPAAEAPASIELRKSFQIPRRAGRQISRSEQRGGAGRDPAGSGSGDRDGTALGVVAAALGEQLQSSGTLFLPGVGSGGSVLRASTTPILETTTGRRLIIDRDHTIEAELADKITRRWPDFKVVQPPPGADLRGVVGSLLDAAGYDTVLRASPLVFGRGITIRFTPDFVVLRSDDDLLNGEPRAISVVEPAEALPPELRALAGEHRVRIVELTPGGAPAGADHAPWRDPTGLLTTIETSRPAQIVEEVAAALGLAVERRVPLPVRAGEPAASADLRISRAGDEVLVFEDAAPVGPKQPDGAGAPAIWLNAGEDLTAATGALLRRFAIPAIGPVVELYRAPKPGTTRRFIIRVPGWLAESGGRRILITGVTPAPQVRLYLTREGVDIIEYRIRDAR